MMFRRYEKGGGRHEPPYTEEEEFEFYRRISEGIASGKAMIYRSRPAAADKQKPQEKDDGETPPHAPTRTAGDGPRVGADDPRSD